MAKIIGIRPSSFKGEEGTTVSGKNFYFTEPLEKGEGLAADRAFVTDAKLNQWAYQPRVGDEVRLEYNRFGRISGMEKVIK